MLRKQGKAERLKCNQGKQMAGRDREKRNTSGYAFFKALMLAFRIYLVCYCLYKKDNQNGCCSDPGAGGAHQWIH